MPKRLLLNLCLLLLVVFPSLICLTANAQEKIKALIVDGQNNHKAWPNTTPMMKQYLEETGLFAVDVATTAPNGTDEDFKPEFNKYDVVISNYNGAPWPEETRKAFDEFVKNGGGFVAVHAANNAFGDWAEYNQMIGLGGWGGRNEKSGPYVYYDEDGKLVRDTSKGNGGHHGPQRPFEIVVRDEEHPITKGLPGSWLHDKDELYDLLRGPATNMQVLATAYAAKDKGGSGRHEPMLMAIDYGKGRVFHTTLGHAEYSMECVGFITTLQRGAEWAATGKVTQEIPKDFPNSDEVSTRKFEAEKKEATKEEPKKQNSKKQNAEKKEAKTNSSGKKESEDVVRWVVYEGKEGPGKGKTVVLLAGDEEYRSEEAMPQLGKILAEHHGFKCVVLFSQDENGTIDPTNQTNIPGMEALADADMMVVAWRFRELPDEDMKYFVDYVDAGKPILGMRTATHSFNYTRNKQSPYANYSFNAGKDWPGGFGRQVLGETWISHHGHHKKESTRGVINEKLKDHPILKGVEDVWGTTDVYGVRNLPDSADVLMYGQVLVGMEPTDEPVAGKKNDPMMPIFWTKGFKSKSGKDSRIICTTMGAATDLESEDFRRALVNSVYWGVGMEDKIPAESKVDIVGKFEPTFYGFNTFKEGVKVSEHLMEK